MDVVVNKHHVYIQDIYILSYYGIKVVFQVAKVTENSVFLVELATKRYKDGLTLTKGLKTSKKPYFVKGNNTRSGTTFEVFTREDKTLPIRIWYDSDIFWEAAKRVSAPLVGTCLAIPFNDKYLSAYWIIEKEIDA